PVRAGLPELVDARLVHVGEVFRADPAEDLLDLLGPVAGPPHLEGARQVDGVLDRLGVGLPGEEGVRAGAHAVCVGHEGVGPAVEVEEVGADQDVLFEDVDEVVGSGLFEGFTHAGEHVVAAGRVVLVADGDAGAGVFLRELPCHFLHVGAVSVVEAEVHRDVPVHGFGQAGEACLGEACPGPQGYDDDVGHVPSFQVGSQFSAYHRTVRRTPSASGTNWDASIPRGLRVLVSDRTTAPGTSPGRIGRWTISAVSRPVSSAAYRDTRAATSPT